MILGVSKGFGALERIRAGSRMAREMGWRTKSTSVRRGETSVKQNYLFNNGRRSGNPPIRGGKTNFQIAPVALGERTTLGARQPQ